MQLSLLYYKVEKELVIGVNHPAIGRGIPHFAFLPVFPHFCENILHFLLHFAKIKFAGNRYNFQLHEEVLWTETVQKRTRRTPAMFSMPNDQIVIANLMLL